MKDNQKQNSRKEKYAFSLAEALITLLIVCLITIASIPILTKKKRNTDSYTHGKYICTRNSAGQHVYWDDKVSEGDINNPDTWPATGDHCTFVPPVGSRNFAVSIAGGGGGGAGAYIAQKIWTNDFAVQYPGWYYLLAIGGGGHGGGSSDNKERAATGGAGAVVAMKLFFNDKVSSIRLQKGVKGGCCEKRDGTDNSGSAAGEGNHSKIIGSYYNDSGILETKTFITAQGGDGGHGGEHGGSDADRYTSPPGYVGMDIPSSIKSASYNGKTYSYSYKCYGKPSGSGYNCSSSNKCGNDISSCANKMWGMVLTKDTSSANKICSGGMFMQSYQKEVNNFFLSNQIKNLVIYPEIECSSASNAFNRNKSYNSLSASQKATRDKYCAIPGIGGGADQSLTPCGSVGHENSKSGSDGYVAVGTVYYMSGGGGKAGSSSTNVFFPKFETKTLKIYVGEGGKGGKTNGTSAGNGSSGGRTYVMNDKNEIMSGLGQNGGIGGYVNYEQQASLDDPGENGGVTNVFYAREPQRGIGGLSTYNGITNSTVDGFKSYGYGDGGGGGGVSASNNEAGNGADGTPGVVIIEW